MKKKILLCFLIILFLSGCTGEYNLTINDNNSITEEINFAENISVIETYSKVNEFLTSEYNLVKQDGRYDSYSINTYSNDGYAYGNGKKEYKNFNNFKNNSIIISEMFNEISLIKDNNLVTIDLIPKDNFKYFEESSLYSALLDSVTLKITLPYKVIDGNYDSVKENTYIWNMSKDNLKEVIIKYQDEMIILNQNKNGLLIIGTIICSLLIMIFIIYIKNKSSNRYWEEL